VFKKMAVLLLLCPIFLNLGGCTSVPGSGQASKELKLRWNVSYIQGLVLVKGAFKNEPIQFGKAIINKDSAELKGYYTDGRIVRIIISKVSSFESSVAVNLGSSPAAQEEARRILEAIAQYSKVGR
jgi:hypothetical protein